MDDSVDWNAMCLFSAGIDSTVAATMLMQSGMRPLLLHIGQEQSQHRKQALAIQQWYKEEFTNEVALEVVDHSALINRVRVGNYIPGYRAFNMITALAFADRYKIRAIYTGELESVWDPNSAMRGTIDPDDKAFTEFLGKGDDVKQLEFREAWKTTRTELADWYSTVYKGEIDSLQFIDPLNGLHKAGIIKLGHALGAPLHLSITCRNPDFTMTDDVYHCGKSDCWACNQRRTGFKLAEVPDPTAYAYDEPIDPEYESEATQLVG